MVNINVSFEASSYDVNGMGYSLLAYGGTISHALWQVSTFISKAGHLVLSTCTEKVVGTSLCACVTCGVVWGSFPSSVSEGESGEHF